jgi:hypothetical protein
MASPGKLRVDDADPSKSKRPRWAWSERYVMSYLNLICGEEKIGKSTLAAWTLARLSKGELDGDLRGEPVNVAVIGDEDSWSDTWVPRLVGAGADLSRVKRIGSADYGLLELKEHRDELRDAILEYDFRVLYIDALDDMVGHGQTGYVGKQVREGLQPLRSLADELGIAIIGSKHAKKRGATFREVLSDSVQFGAASRSTMFLARHPDGGRGELVLAHGAGNLSDADSLEFAIRSKDVTLGGETWSIGVASEFRDSGLTTDDLLDRFSGERTPKMKKASKATQARQHLEAVLPPGELVLSTDVLAELEEMDLGAANTVKRARELAGVEAVQKAGAWWWRRELTNSPGA